MTALTLDPLCLRSQVDESDVVYKSGWASLTDLFLIMFNNK